MAKLTQASAEGARQARSRARKLYPVDNALAIVKECATAKFDESIDVAVSSASTPRSPTRSCAARSCMPNGTGKTMRVAVFAQGDKAEEAKAAGADIVGMDDLAASIKAGSLISTSSSRRPTRCGSSARWGRSSARAA